MQWAIEMILMKQLASHLATPIVLVDLQGDVVFFNTAAEQILGTRFEEVRGMARGQWLDAVRAQQTDGASIDADDRALVKAVDRDEPSHVHFRLQGLDGIYREVEGIAFPMIGQSGRKLGAVGVFWETAST